MTLDALEWRPPTLAEWLDRDEAGPEWLLDKLIPTDSLVLLSGQQKLAGKSLFAEAISLVLASGKEYGIFKPASGEPTSVLYLQEEGAAKKTRQRIAALCTGMSIPTDALDKIFWAFRYGIKLDNMTWRDRLCALIDEIRPGLIVLDSMFVLHSADENSSSELKPVFETFQAVRQASQGGSLLYLAHLDKGRGSQPSMDIDLQVRGSSTMVNIYDVHLAARRYKESDESVSLHVRYRDEDPLDFSLAWQFGKRTDKRGNKILDRITLKARQILPEDELAEACLVKIQPDTEYTPDALKKLWRIPMGKAMQFYEQFINEGYLKKTGQDGIVILAPPAENSAEQSEESAENVLDSNDQGTVEEQT